MGQRLGMHEEAEGNQGAEQQEQHEIENEEDLANCHQAIELVRLLRKESC